MFFKQMKHTVKQGPNKQIGLFVQNFASSLILHIVLTTL